MTQYNIVAETNDVTVVAEYEPTDHLQEAYQSEASLENEFVKLLVSQGYEKVSINNENDLIKNLRNCLQKINKIEFSDKEWKSFFNDCIANKNDNVLQKTRKVQDDHVQVLKRDDGSSKNIYLIDKANVNNNIVQVINQYEEENGKHNTRYDVTILVNGLPMVHVELKKRGGSIREAFNQIKRYQRDSFWAGSGLYEYIQIFVISNGTYTKYYSNTTRYNHIKENDNVTRANKKKTSNSYEFTSYWADATNKPIFDLIDFTKTFLVKRTLLNILTRYCVFTADDMLLVMRPYQIAATEKILNKIEISTNYKKTGTVDAGGYIWHTTGSGKTLTSFKTAQLATRLSAIDKVLFVVDRKDLDYQTIQEYEKFQKGCVTSNKTTKILQQQIEDPNCRIIITTIQKLERFVKTNKGHASFNQHFVIIFDECHRSQFGDMHESIVKAFKKYHIFGFTGTPIFAENSSSGGKAHMKTTPQAFGDKLHTYTIVDAIRDGNVLPFRIDYVNTLKMKPSIADKDVKAIDIESAMNNPERIREVTKYILEHFDQKTRRNANYTHKGKRVNGFNSIFAVSSIPTSMKYYVEFKKQLQETGRKLNIATIFSFGANEQDSEDGIIEEGFDIDSLDKSSRDFLEDCIKDYNSAFNTNFDTSSDKFENYYKDLSLRVKNREIDLLIVVNMFLTGFDATTLNTLWVDKNLKMHGLIQAYSRTNRILNSVKTYGNIVCFRDLESNTNEALALFGNKEASGIVLLRTYDEYMNGYTDDKGKYHLGYKELIERLQTEFKTNELITDEEDKKQFIALFGAILKLKNILSSFDDFDADTLINPVIFQDYTSNYIDLFENRPKVEGEDISSDIEFEMELVKQVDIDITYILNMVQKYKDTNCQDKQIMVDIMKAVDSSFQLRSKKKLIEQFIESVNNESNIDHDWEDFIREKKQESLEEIIQEENLKPDETQKFISNAFRDASLKTSGSDLDRILPPTGIFSGGNRKEKKDRVADKLSKFFEMFFGIID